MIAARNVVSWSNNGCIFPVGKIKGEQSFLFEIDTPFQTFLETLHTRKRNILTKQFISHLVGKTEREKFPFLLHFHLRAVLILASKTLTYDFTLKKA